MDLKLLLFFFKKFSISFFYEGNMVQEEAMTKILDFKT